MTLQKGLSARPWSSIRICRIRRGSKARISCCSSWPTFTLAEAAERGEPDQNQNRAEQNQNRLPTWDVVEGRKRLGAQVNSALLPRLLHQNLAVVVPQQLQEQRMRRDGQNQNPVLQVLTQSPAGTAETRSEPPQSSAPTASSSSKLIRAQRPAGARGSPVAMVIPRREGAGSDGNGGAAAVQSVD